MLLTTRHLQSTIKNWTIRRRINIFVGQCLQRILLTKKKNFEADSAISPLNPKIISGGLTSMKEWRFGDLLSGTAAPVSRFSRMQFTVFLGFCSLMIPFFASLENVSGGGASCSWSPSHSFSPPCQRRKSLMIHSEHVIE